MVVVVVLVEEKRRCSSFALGSSTTFEKMREKRHKFVANPNYILFRFSVYILSIKNLENELCYEISQYLVLALAPGFGILLLILKYTFYMLVLEFSFCSTSKKLGKNSCFSSAGTFSITRAF